MAVSAHFRVNVDARDSIACSLNKGGERVKANALAVDRSSTSPLLDFPLPVRYRAP